MRRLPGLILIAGAAVVVVAMFLPWITVSAPFVGTVTESIMQGGGSDGPIITTLAAVAILVGLGMVLRGPAWWASAAAIALLFVAAVVAVMDLGNAQSAQNSVPDFVRQSGLVSASIETGVYVCAAGILVGAAGAVLGLFGRASPAPAGSDRTARPAG